MANRRMSASHLILAAVLLCSQVSIVLSVEGRLFFLAFMDPTVDKTPNSGIQEIHVSGSLNVDTKVRIQVASLNKTYMYMLNSTNNWSKTLTVFPDLAGPGSTKLPVSVIVSSEQPISVQANKAEDGTSGGYLALPITAESTQYYVASYTPRGPSQGFSIAAPFHTCVTVYKENGPEQIRELDVSLNPGQVFHVNSSGDLTGRYVLSMKPIAVFSGLDCAYVAQDVTGVQKCDHIVEQLHPVSEFGQVFVMSSFQGRDPAKGFQIRVVATFRTEVNWAEIEYDPVTNTPKPAVIKSSSVITRGNYLELTAGRGTSNPVVVVLSCDVGCEVMQYGVSNDMPSTGAEPNGKPDSTMITVPGLRHYTNDITFSTSKFYTLSTNQSLENVNGLTVIAKTSEISSIMLDGSPLTSTLPGAKQVVFTFPTALNVDGVSVPTETYTLVYGGAITPGFHRVTVTDNNIRYAVMVYGHAPSGSPSDSEGYAYLGGMRYSSPLNAPILEGPFFNFDAPAGEIPIGEELGGEPITPRDPVTPTEFPSYESIWEARFYVLYPQRADLKTRNCSEAYHKYYLEERFAPMQKKVANMATQSCAPSVNVTMTHLLYYSEYTDGLIRFRLSITASGSVTLNDMYDCLGLITDYISLIQNWVPFDYKDETSFLRPDAYYNRGCDELHVEKPNFESFYYGWNCPTKNGLIGSSDASTVKASGIVLACLAVISAIVFHQR